MVFALFAAPQACSAAGKTNASTVVSPAPHSPSDPCSNAVAAAQVQLARGQWLRARQQLRASRSRCPVRVDAELTQLQTQLDAERSPAALLQVASEARGAGDVATARRAEASAVVALERQSAQSLRVIGRMVHSGVRESRGGKHLTVLRADAVEVHDAQSGALLSRIRRLEDFNNDVELNTSAQRLVVRVSSHDAFTRIRVYDSQTGAPLTRLIASDWRFSGDGSRLAFVQRLEGRANVVLLDSDTLQEVARIPLPCADDGSIGSHSMVLDAPGSTLAVGHGRGLSLIDMADGTVHQLAGAEGEAVSAEGRRILWWDDRGVGLWDGATEREHRFTRPNCYGRPAALSADGQKVALMCEDEIVVWSPDSNESVRLPDAAAVTRLHWLANGRYLRVSDYVDYEEQWGVYDTLTKRRLPIAGSDEQLLDVSGNVGLALVEARNGERRLVRLGDDGSLSNVAHDCSELEPNFSDTLNDTLIGCTVKGEPKLLRFETGTDAFVELSTDVEFPPYAETPITLGSEAYWTQGAFVIGTPASDDSTYALGDPGFEPQRRLDVAGPELHVSVEARAPNPRCGPVAVSRFERDLAWSLACPYPLCDRYTGKVIAHLPLPEPPERLSTTLVSFDGRFLITYAVNSRLFNLETGKEVHFPRPPLELRFAGPLVIGFDGEGAVGVWEPDSGRRIATWAGYPYIPATADVELGVAVVNAHNEQPLRIVSLDTGIELAQIGVTPKAVSFGPNGLLAAVEHKEVSFWTLPDAQSLRAGARPRRVGSLLLRSSGAVFIADSGEFESSDEPLQLRRLLRCEVGLTELPLEVCVDAFQQRGLTARLLELGPQQFTVFPAPED